MSGFNGMGGGAGIKGGGNDVTGTGFNHRPQEFYGMKPGTPGVMGARPPQNDPWRQLLSGGGGPYQGGPVPQPGGGVMGGPASGGIQPIPAPGMPGPNPVPMPGVQPTMTGWNPQQNNAMMRMLGGFQGGGPPGLLENGMGPGTVGNASPFQRPRWRY